MPTSTNPPTVTFPSVNYDYPIAHHHHHHKPFPWKVVAPCLVALLLIIGVYFLVKKCLHQPPSDPHVPPTLLMVREMKMI